MNDPRTMMPSYIMPEDQERFAAQWWRIADAARAWRCSIATAHRLVNTRAAECGRTVVWIASKRGASARVVVPKGTKRPQTRVGNPRFSRQNTPKVVQ